MTSHFDFDCTRIPADDEGTERPVIAYTDARRVGRLAADVLLGAVIAGVVVWAIARIVWLVMA